LAKTKGELAMKSRPLVVVAVWMTLSLSPGIVEAAAAPGWEAQWERTVAAARKEGRVTIYTSSNQNTLLLESGAFQKRFPEIKLIVVLGDAVARIMAERRAGKYLADIAFTGPSTLWQLHLAKVLDPIKDAIILPEVADESKWYRGKHEYVDQERKYIFASVGNAQNGNLYYNTKLINPKDFQSLWDFLRPELKGRIAARDVRTSGPGTATMRFFYHTPELGPKFIHRLFSEMDITLFRDQRQGVDWLATGKYPICLFCNETRVETAKVQGLPVEVFRLTKEGVELTASGGAITLVNRAPHPNAAKVFINWYLSREGQIALQSLEGGATNSRRMDIPKDMVPPRRLLTEGVRYLEVDTWERISVEPALKVFTAALAEAERRKRQ
jgi:iron(III) transport system substrate-binding protein